MSAIDTTLTLDELKQHARSVDDLAHWLDANPKEMLGAIHFGPGCFLKSAITLDRALLLRQANSNDLISLGLRVTMGTPLQSDFVKPTLSLNSAHETIAGFEYSATLDLPLADWPLATALVAETFVVDNYSNTGSTSFKKLSPKLNVHFSRHFPGWTMDKLRNLAQADLLPEGSYTLKPGGPICALLFASRDAVTAPLPSGDYNLG